MATDKQLAAARANGAKSRGPTSPEGKLRSAQNARKHGLASPNSCVILAGEDEALFQQTCDHYLQRFQPADPVEAALVLEMVQADWRLRRARSIENSLLELEMLTTEHKHPEFENLDLNGHIALAFKDLNDAGPSLSVLNRYAARLHREFHRAFKTLRLLQAERNQPDPPEPQPIANAQQEPEPTGDTEAQPRGPVRVSPIPWPRPVLPNEPDFAPSTPQTPLATPPQEESEPPECV